MRDRGLSEPTRSSTRPSRKVEPTSAYPNLRDSDTFAPPPPRKRTKPVKTTKVVKPATKPSTKRKSKDLSAVQSTENTATDEDEIMNSNKSTAASKRTTKKRRTTSNAEPTDQKKGATAKSSSSKAPTTRSSSLAAPPTRRSLAASTTRSNLAATAEKTDTTTTKKSKSLPKRAAKSSSVEENDKSLEENIVPTKSFENANETLELLKSSKLQLSPNTADSSVKQVLSYQMSKDMSMEMAKLRDEIASLRSKVQANESEGGSTSRNYFAEYKKTNEAKMDEYEKLIADLRVKVDSLEGQLEKERISVSNLDKKSLQAKTIELDQENARLLNEIDEWKKSHSDAKDLIQEKDQKIEELEVKLKESNEDVNLVQGEIVKLEKDHVEMKNAKDKEIDVLTKSNKEFQSRVTILEGRLEEARVNASQASSDYLFNLEQMTKLYEEATGMVIQSVTKNDTNNVSFKILHQGKNDKVSNFRYILSAPHVGQRATYKYTPVLSAVSETDLPAYLMEEVEFKSVNAFYKKVYEYVVGMTTSQQSAAYSSASIALPKS